MIHVIEYQNMQVTNHKEQPSHVKNLILLGLAGVGAKIFLVLAVKLIEFYFPLPGIEMNAQISIRNVLLLVFDFPAHLLVFGVIIALAYKYGCVLVNARNLFLCVFAAFALEGILLTGFSNQALVFAQSLGFEEGQIPIHVLTHLPLDMAAYTSPIYLLLLAMISIAGAQLVFHGCAKADSCRNHLPLQQSRFLMLLAFVCVLCGLFATAIVPSAITLLNLFNRSLTIEDFFVWMDICHIVFKFLFLFFAWISYLIAARYFPKNYTTDKRNTISYAIGVIIFLAFLYIAIMFILVILFSAFYRRSLSDITSVILGTIIGCVFPVWMYARMRSIKFCLLLFVFSLLHSVAFLLIFNDFKFENLDYLEVIFSVKFFTDFFLNALLSFAAAELPGWIIYSLAIQGSIKLMIAPDKPVNPPVKPKGATEI